MMLNGMNINIGKTVYSYLLKYSTMYEEKCTSVIQLLVTDSNFIVNHNSVLGEGYICNPILCISTAKHNTVF